MYLGFILERQTLGCGQERNSIAWRTKEELQFKLEHVIKRFPLPIASQGIWICNMVGELPKHKCGWG